SRLTRPAFLCGASVRGLCGPLAFGGEFGGSAVRRPESAPKGGAERAQGPQRDLPRAPAAGALATTRAPPPPGLSAGAARHGGAEGERGEGGAAGPPGAGAPQPPLPGLVIRLRGVAGGDVARRDHGPAVRAKRHGPDPAGVPLEPGAHPSRGQVPELDLVLVP